MKLGSKLACLHGQRRPILLAAGFFDGVHRGHQAIIRKMVSAARRERGAAFGCGAHLEQLRRTQIGEFDLEQAARLDDLLRLDRNQLLEKLIPLTRVNLQPARTP